MRITIKDISSLPQFSGLKLIAGEGGLKNHISRCGILDYEYDKNVKDKYYHTNFVEEQLVLTSFLYAKDNDYLVADAVKRLVSRGCSGLIIKNIFRLQMHESMLRYADSKGFPIFILEDSHLFFEDMIVFITNRIRLAESLELQEKKIDVLLTSKDNDASLTAQTLLLNPSFKPELLSCYIKPDEPSGAISTESYSNFMESLTRKGFFASSDALFRYRNGLLLIHTRDLFLSGDSLTILQPLINAIHEASEHLTTGPDSKGLSIGASGLHHSLSSMAQAISESVFAFMLPVKAESNCTFFENLGIYQLLMSSFKDPAMERFRIRYITPLLDFDLENKSNLLETAVQFVQWGGSIDETAKRLYQHKNTIRYRLNKAGRLLNLNVLLPEGYEVLSLAVKLHICAEAVSSHKEYPIYD